MCGTQEMSRSRRTSSGYDGNIASVRSHLADARIHPSHIAYPCTTTTTVLSYASRSALLSSTYRLPIAFFNSLPLLPTRRKHSRVFFRARVRVIKIIEDAERKG